MGFGFSVSNDGSSTAIQVEPNQVHEIGPTSNGPGYAGSAYPYGQGVKLEVAFQLGSSDLQEGTGFLIGPHTILTAAHLLFDRFGREATKLVISGTQPDSVRYDITTLVSPSLVLVHTG